MTELAPSDPAYVRHLLSLFTFGLFGASDPEADADEPEMEAEPEL